MYNTNKIALIVAILPFLLYASVRFCSTSLFHQLSKPYSILFGKMTEEENCKFCAIVRAEDPEKLIYKVSNHIYVKLKNDLTYVYGI